jgi:hypothetical protein
VPYTAIRDTSAEDQTESPEPKSPAEFEAVELEDVELESSDSSLYRMTAISQELTDPARSDGLQPPHRDPDALSLPDTNRGRRGSLSRLGSYLQRLQSLLDTGSSDDDTGKPETKDDSCTLDMDVGTQIRECTDIPLAVLGGVCAQVN